jgi:uncharacterized protein (DUF2336 family)
MAIPQGSLITELERATRSGSHDKCAETLQRVTDLFLAGADRFTEDHVRIFENVLEFLVQRIENRARAELSTRLALVKNAPIRIIQQLARNDDITVAEPVLARSTRLTGDDLVQIARTKSQDHLMAISGRPQLEESVTDILLDRGNREVIHKLAQNAGACFSEAGYTTLVVKAGTDERLAETVGLRVDIPNHLFERLLVQATKTVRSRLLTLAPPETQREIRRVLASVSKEVGWELTANRDFAGAKELVNALHARGQLNEGALVEFAKQRKYEEIVATLSLLCSAPLEVIDSLMSSPRNDAMLIAFRAAKLSWATVSVIVNHRPSRNALTNHDREVLCAEYSRLSQATAQRVLGFWQARASDPQQRH